LSVRTQKLEETSSASVGDLTPVLDCSVLLLNWKDLKFRLIRPTALFNDVVSDMNGEIDAYLNVLSRAD
jgi:hypothetical protein